MKEWERVGSIKFLGVLLDEHLSRKEHIGYSENKIAKSIGLLYRAKPFLGKHSSLTLHYSYIHTYLNYANLSWAGTNRTNLKKLLNHATGIVKNKTRVKDTKALFNAQTILNIYKLNILTQQFSCIKSIMRLLLQYFPNFFRKSLIRIQQCFQNCAARYLKQIY